MRKRILSILLTLCMLLCLVPTSVFAEDEAATGTAAIQFGIDVADVLNKNINTTSAATVYFGQDHENNPGAWRVIDYDGNSAAGTAGNMTLLAANNMGLSKFGASNAYADSELKEAIDTLAGKLTAKETDAVEKRTLASGSYNRGNTDCVAGEQVDNAVFWPLSTAEAFAVNQDLRIVDKEHQKWASSHWWLRSPGEKDRDVASVDGFGNIDHDGIDISNMWGVRPAFNLDLNSVLFASAAAGGKPDGFKAVPEYTGNEWKLTIKDSSRKIYASAAKTNLKAGETLSVEYFGATNIGENEYISAMIADSAGNILYYGRVAHNNQSQSGTANVTVPSDLADGSYTLKLFSEQCNGDYKTDYAGEFRNISFTVKNKVNEQFTLTPGGRYYFDLSAMNIPGTVNSNLPDSTLHYVPFTYAGTVDAYSLKNEADNDTTSYEHSLFIANYNVTHTISWNDLNTAGLIFGKDYVAGGVGYTLRAPSVGSDHIGSGDIERGTPQSNEWDAVLDKNSGYIKNWNGIYSWGQDTTRYNSSCRAIRGYNSARFWNDRTAAFSFPYVGFRPVLEILNPNTLGSDGLKVVTLDLGGGKLGGSSENIQIIVKSSESFAAPASDGMTRPDGNTSSYFMWLGSDGKLYAPGANVPADVTKLTAQFALSEQFTLTPGGRYYFDLSAMNIPGTVNDALPDNTLHYVPFTYAGTVDAYKLTSETATTEEYAQKNKYPHSLFVADYAVTNDVSWDALNTADLIFSKNYASGGVDYTLRTPSAGSDCTGLDDSQRGVPQSNEWDTMLNKDSGYIQNWNGMFSWGQDTFSGSTSFRAIRGCYSARNWNYGNATYSYPNVGFRPVLEVLNADTLGSDGLKAVTLDLGGGKLGNSSEDIQIIVKTGSEFTAPASDGMTRPDGNTGSYFMWLDGNGNSYAPGGSVPADVTELTVQWTAPTYAVTLHPNGGTIADGKDVTGYTYGVGATLPTDVTRTGYTFKGWYDNEGLTGDPVTAIGDTETGNKEYWAKWEINQYTVTVKPENGKADITITQDYGTPITAPTLTREGYQFNGWDKAFPTTMPAEDLTITAQWRDIAAPTGEIKIAENGWKSFFNTITFGLFFKDTQEVTINAADNSGTVFVSYLVTDRDLSEAELQSLVFNGYDEPFRIEPNGEYIVYAMLVDASMNITYLRSDRLTIDNVQPVITGIENGKTYCEAQTVTVDEKYVDTVTVNGTAVTLDENGSFVLSPADGEQKIVVTDKAGNAAEMTVTVNDGHTFGEWTSNGDGTHTRKCTVDGCNGVETKDCSGGTATCTEKAVCEVCGKAYGELDANNHSGLKHIDAKAATKDAEGNIEYWYCNGCGKYYSDKDGTKEIKKADTVTTKLKDDSKSPQTGDSKSPQTGDSKSPQTGDSKSPQTGDSKSPQTGDSKSPQTGDSSNFALWLALLFISGGAAIGTTVVSRKKKYNR